MSLLHCNAVSVLLFCWELNEINDAHDAYIEPAGLVCQCWSCSYCGVCVRACVRLLFYRLLQLVLLLQGIISFIACLHLL